MLLSWCDCCLRSNRRVLAVDANRNLLISLTEEGVQPSAVDVAFGAAVTWPHQIRCFETTGTGTATSLASATLFISEYLGKALCVAWQEGLCINVILSLQDECGRQCCSETAPLGSSN